MANILLIDDEASVLGVLNAILETDGHTVKGIKNSQEAAEVIKSDEPFDIIMSDIRMSPIDGMEILRIAAEARPDTPVIIVTAYTSQNTARQALELGAFEYIIKPFNTAKLLNAVQRAAQKIAG